MVERDWGSWTDGGATKGIPTSGFGREQPFRSQDGDRAVTMGSIDRYIFRTTLASFALVLVSLTGVIWITQALRGIDLMTSQGQTIITFLGVTSLVIPALVLIISPIALMIAISHTLNKLATDSEIIVMNAAGFSPFRLFRPFLYATCVVAILVGFIAAYLAPDGMRRLKQWDAEITADVLANILQPGRFAQLDQNLTIRIRERQPGGLLVGIFIDDRRDPNERVSIIADHGTIVKNEGGSFLILEDGNLERFELGKRDPALVAFGRYAFDMSKFSNQGHDVALGIRERYLWELLSPSSDDPVYMQIPGQFRAELHDRFMAPIYPFAFAALTFAFLGAPRTTRQSRNFSMSSSILAVFGLRMAGFACSVMAVKSPLAPIVQYLMLAAAIGASLWIIIGGVVVEPPAALMEAINKSNARLLRLFGRPATA
jgi:lipopolysaccharide export system permease protein